ncbi:unnamed protein product [Soboliphyme baturini]|uniref:Carbonic anhydrase n=1 Tax=Soboliphyme baturini TaxID=241478 RepID=A0A183J467_9BILA|nr:unnamed protein product [Soboliphyme baturini]
MSTKAIQKLLRGVLTYRSKEKAALLQKLKEIQKNPNPLAVVVSCMDGRVLNRKLMQSDVGDLYLVKNPSNMVPAMRGNDVNQAAVAAVAALQMTTVLGGIRDIIVFGHGNCSAISAMYQLFKENKPLDHSSPVDLWLRGNAASSWERFQKFMNNRQPLHYMQTSDQLSIEVHIDVERMLDEKDTLSQIHCLQQLENIASYPIIRDPLESGKVKIHAMWFNIYTGEVSLFSRKNKKFVVVTEDTINSVD